MHTRFLTPAILLTLAIQSLAHADTYTWADTTANLSDPTAWSGPAPIIGGSSTDQLLFGTPDGNAADYTATVDSNGPWILNSLTFGSPTTYPWNNAIVLAGLPNGSLLFQGPNPTITSTNIVDALPIIALPITAVDQLTITGSALLITAPLSFTGQNTQLNIQTQVTYQNNTAPANLSQVTISRSEFSSAGLGLTWSYTPTGSAPIALSFGSGPININSGSFNFNVLPDSSAPSPQIDVTNPFNIITNGLLSTAYNNSNDSTGAIPNSATVRYTGPIHLNGELDLHPQTEMILAGNITLDQSSTDDLQINAITDSNNITITGNILDDPDPTHTSTQPLSLANYSFSLPPHALIIAGKSNTYSVGTVIDSINDIFVTPDSRLGTGPVTIYVGILHFSAPTNIAPNQKVLIIEDGTLAISFDADPSSIIDPASGGTLAFDINFSTPLNLATLGNGRMSLGSANNSSYTAPTLAPGLDNTYRIARAFDTQDSFLTLTHSVLIDYNNTPTSAQLGGVILPVPNSYSGGTLITDEVHADSPGALGTGNVSVGIALNPYASLLLSAPNAYAATAQIDVYGTLAAVGPNGSIPLTNNAPILHPGSTLTLGDNINNNSNRYPDSLPIALRSSTLQINATGITTESIGPFSFSGVSTLTFQNPSAGNHSTILLTPSITRENHSVLFINLMSGSFDPASTSYANLIAATPPTVTNNMLSPAFQSRGTTNPDGYDPTTNSSFLTYTPSGFAPTVYTTFPTTSGTGTEIVDLSNADFNIYRPIPGNLNIILDSLPSNLLSLLSASQGQLPAFTPPSPPPNMFAAATSTSLYALRTSIDIHNPDSGPVTLHIASGGLILSATNSGLLIETNLNFDSAEAIINTDNDNFNETSNQITGQITAAHGLTKVGQGSLTLSNLNNVITGPLTILEGQLTLPSLPSPNSSDPLIITSLASLQFTDSVTLTRPVHFIDAGPNNNVYFRPASIVLPNGNTLTIAAPITGNAYTTLAANKIVISSPITIFNSINLEADAIQINANISCTGLSLSGNVTGAATLTTSNGTFLSYGQISPGNNPGDLATISIIAPNATNDALQVDEGTAFNFDLDSTGHSDHLLIDGSLGLYPDYPQDRATILNLNFLTPPTGDIYTLITASSLTGTFSTVTGLPANYSLDYTPTSLLLIPTPEPATLLLLTPFFLLRRRKNFLTTPFHTRR